VAALVHVLGVLVLLAVLAGVLGRWYVHVDTGQPISVDLVVRSAAALGAGVVGGGLLLAAAAGLRYADALLRGTDRRVSIGASGTSSGSGVMPLALASSPNQPEGWPGERGGMATQAWAMPPGPTLAEILAAVEELRDLAGLPEEQRAAARGRLATRRRERLLARINEALDDARVSEARELLADARAWFLPSPELDRLALKLATVAQRTEPSAYASVIGQVEEAAADGDWAGAEQAARGLTQAYPDSARCKQVWEAARLGRRYALVQEHTRQRRWREAVAAAEEFLAAYPDSVEARFLSVEILTLRQNAEIQRRKRYEAQFKEYVRARRLPEALRLAKHVVETFPNSPQAEVLRKQIPVLERRAGG